MDFESINDQIKSIEFNLESIKAQIQIYENQQKQLKNESNPEKLGAANRTREIYNCFKKGMNPMEIAEYMHDELGGCLFDNYCFINSIVWKEREKRKYARNYLINALFENGFKKAEISQIANVSPQRCGQIIRESHF